MVQLDLFGNENSVVYITKPAKTSQVTPFTTPSQPSQQQSPPPEITIERNPSPLKGFRVVQALGLTHITPKNPCLSCDRAGENKEGCSGSRCMNRFQRKMYLEKIGAGGINVSVDFDVAYGC